MTVSAATSPAPVPVAGPDRYLNTDEVRKDLYGHSIRGGVVMVVSRATQLVVGLGCTLVLARLLTPRDFGLVAMVGTLMGLVGAFKDFGLTTTTVHHSHISQLQASSLFWRNTRLSLGLAGFVVAMAPVLAWFYGHSELVAITLAMGGGTLAMGLSMMHLGLLRRQMRFGVITVIELSAVLAGAVLGIGAAQRGAGYWALVIQQVVTHLTQAVALWLACRWRPSSFRQSCTNGDDDGLRAMLSYGRAISASRIMSYVGKNIELVLVGRFAGAVPLGLYQRAHFWAVLPFQQVHLALLNVAVSGFSRLHGPENVAPYRAAFRKAMRLVLIPTLPATAFLAVRARDVILLLLGPQWTDAAPLLRLLSVAAFVASVGQLTKWVYFSEGRAAAQLRWSLFTMAVTSAAVAVGIWWSMIGVAWAHTIATFALAYPSAWYCLKDSPIRMRDYWGAAARPALACAVAAALLLALSPWLPYSRWVFLRLLTAGVLFGAVYLAFWLATPGGRRELSEAIALLKSFKAAPRPGRAAVIAAPAEVLEDPE